MFTSISHRFLTTHSFWAFFPYERMNTSSFPNCFYCYLFKKYKVFCACLYCKGTLFTNFNRSLTPWVPEHVNKLYSLSRIEHTYVISNLLSIGYHSGFIVKLWPIVLKTVQKTPKVMFPVAMVLTFTYIKKKIVIFYTQIEFQINLIFVELLNIMIYLIKILLNTQESMIKSNEIN